MQIRNNYQLNGKFAAVMDLRLIKALACLMGMSESFRKSMITAVP